MISKNEIRRIVRLHRKKGRSEENRFLVEGVKGVHEVLNSELDVEAVYVSDESLVSGMEMANLISDKEMSSISALSSPSPALAVVAIPEMKSIDISSLVTEKLLVLNDISDPGNLGTILRTADWFGIKHILISEETVDEYNPKVVQATMGSLFRVQLHRANLHEILTSFIEEKPDYVIAVADMEGKDSVAMKTIQAGALVIGSEAHGLSEDIRQMATDTIAIEGEGNTESLNASIAAAILMYAWTH